MSTVTDIRAEEVEAGILRITLDGATTRNSIGRDQYDALRATLIDAATRRDLRAVVLTGAGGFFSSGGNVSALKEGRALPLSEVMKNTDALGAMILALRNCPLPVIGAVEGGAAGLGLALALSCDMLVASEAAKFTAAYVKIGLTPDGGTTHFLREALPRQLVSEMCLLGRPLPAARLHQAGAINLLTPEGGALEGAMELARACAKGPRTAMAAIKAEIEAAPLNGLAAQLDLEARGINTARYGDEAGEGLAAFLEKRTPDFGPQGGEGESR
ncbi:oxepin-CoA hydrolase, alternative type [Oceanicola sp. S124]|uniref:oxepin-CoA hydrolase, alternative type n=1 Tax=Oceanicola sp. S124 TaxID=1042378 RepID=UPI0002558257|nr:enoyl-CoA hydratase-related protein [Oceanicola sp. S124]